MVCGLSQVSLANCNKVLALRGKKRLVANYLLCKTKPVNWLPPQVRSLKINAHLKLFASHTVVLTFGTEVGSDSNLRD